MRRRNLALWSCAILAALLAAPLAAHADTNDPDQAAKVASDVNLSLLSLKGNVYRLTVQNQSGVGAIDAFSWVPGPGWKVTSVLGSSKGTCSAVRGAISCKGKIEAPKKCTCQPGGQMTITFTMKGPPAKKAKGQGTVTTGTAGGYIVVKTVTLVPRHIPSALPGI